MPGMFYFEGGREEEQTLQVLENLMKAVSVDDERVELAMVLTASQLSSMIRCFSACSLC